MPTMSSWWLILRDVRTTLNIHWLSVYCIQAWVCSVVRDMVPREGKGEHLNRICILDRGSLVPSYRTLRLTCYRSLRDRNSSWRRTGSSLIKRTKIYPGRRTWFFDLRLWARIIAIPWLTVRISTVGPIPSCTTLRLSLSLLSSTWIHPKSFISVIRTSTSKLPGSRQENFRWRYNR